MQPFVPKDQNRQKIKILKRGKESGKRNKYQGGL